MSNLLICVQDILTGAVMTACGQNEIAKKKKKINETLYFESIYKILVILPVQMKVKKKYLCRYEEDRRKCLAFSISIQKR